MRNLLRGLVCLILMLLPCGSMAAEDALSGPVNPNKTISKAIPARELFGAVTTPTPLVSTAIGCYRWYKDGKREDKANTFTDFIAAGDYLAREKFT